MRWILDAVGKKDEDLDNSWCCAACGDQVSEDVDQCPFCGFDRTTLDPDDPYAGESVMFRFDQEIELDQLKAELADPELPGPQG